VVVVVVLLWWGERSFVVEQRKDGRMRSKDFMAEKKKHAAPLLKWQASTEHG
jgi:hypothetical protein